MKPLCSVRRQGDLHVVTFPQTNTQFIYGENSYVGKKPARKRILYPGKSHKDPQFQAFVEKRKAEIKAHVTVSSHFMSEAEEQMLDSILSMPSESVSRIIHFNHIKNVVADKR